MFNSCDLKQSLYISQFQHDNLMLEKLLLFLKIFVYNINIYICD